MTTYLSKHLRRTALITIGILFIAAWFGNKTKAQSSADSAVVIGVYEGFDEDGFYVFTDLKGATLIFQDAVMDLDFDLYDEDILGMEFEVSWKEVDAEEYNEDGDPTGKMIKIKQITGLKAS